MAVELKVTGIPDLKAALKSIPDKLRRRALRNALAAGARLVRDEARQKAPVLSTETNVPYRKPGTVRDAISVRTSKIARRSGDVGVFVNVKPLPGAKYKTSTSNVFGMKVKRRVLVKASQRSAKNPKDPFYWRFVNFGTVKMRGTHFLEAGAEKLSAALEKFKEVIGPQIEKLNNGRGTEL
jgi:HK97 gp10 family phage protein